MTAAAGDLDRQFFEFSYGGQTSSGKVEYDIAGRYFYQGELPKEDFDQLSFPQSFSSEYLAELSQAQYIYGNQEVRLDPLTQEDSGYSWGITANLILHTEDSGEFTISYQDWTKREDEGFRYLPIKRRSPYSEWFNRQNQLRIAHQLEGENFTNDIALTVKHFQVLPSDSISQQYLTEPNGLNPDIITGDPSTWLFDIQTVLDANGNQLQGYGQTERYYMRNWEYRLEDRVTFQLDEKNTLVTGIQLINVDVQGDYYVTDLMDNSVLYQMYRDNVDRHKRDSIGLYGQLTWHFNDEVIGYLGGRSERSRDEDDNGYDVFVPRVALVWKPTNQSVYRFQYSEAFQEASDWTRFSTDSDLRPFASPNLNPEKMEAFEFGVSYQAGESTYLNGAVYLNQVTDLITAVSNNDPALPGAIHFENIGKLRIKGYQLEAKSKWNENLSSFVHISGADNELMNDSGNYLNQGDIAPYQIGGGITYQPASGKWSLHLHSEYVPEIKTVNWTNTDDGPHKTQIESYWNTGVTLNYLLSDGKYKAELVL
ncbi:MAG: TonB-dependent receptor, partial [Kangiellaceae bacterium]|nr:TonB-dependent receptor [Kangiellaceae bacterium]